VSDPRVIERGVLTVKLVNESVASFIFLHWHIPIVLKLQRPSLTPVLSNARASALVMSLVVCFWKCTKQRYYNHIGLYILKVYETVTKCKYYIISLDFVTLFLNHLFKSLICRDLVFVSKYLLLYLILYPLLKDGTLIFARFNPTELGQHPIIMKTVTKNRATNICLTTNVWHQHSWCFSRQMSYILTNKDSGKSAYELQYLLWLRK
jgi:hypothetical protein